MNNNIFAEGETMRAGTLIIVAVVLLAASLIAGAQEPPRKSPSPQNEKELERYGKAFEKYERDLNVTIEACSQYRFGKDVNVDVLLTNTSSEPLWTDIWNQYLQEEPELTKNGKTVKYRTDEDVTFEGKLRVVDFRERSTSIDTHATKKVRTVNLLDWYKTLEPGSYELTIGHRFWLKGKAFKSNPVTIEIVP